MALADYSDLLGSVKNWLKKPEIVQQAPDFIALAEAGLNRRIRTRRMQSFAATTVTTEFNTLPPDFSGLLTATLTDGTLLTILSPDEMAQKVMNTGGHFVGRPYYIAIIGSQFRVFPAPDDSYPLTMLYFAALASLESSVTNWLLLTNPDVYLYGTLMQAAPYLGDDKRISVWSALYEKAVNEINQNDRGETYGARLQMQNSHPTP